MSRFATAVRNVLKVTQAYLVRTTAETQRRRMLEYGIQDPTGDGKTDRVDGVRSCLVYLPLEEHGNERPGDLDWAL